MTRPLCIEFENAFYHVMSRGLNRQDLFSSNDDFRFFLYLLNQAKEKFEYICHSYCLMNNHYHLYIQTPLSNLSLIMKYLNENYARYFLEKNPDKDGHVFKGRYKRKIVQSDLYSLQLSRYIHLNPVKAKLVDHPHNWSWSSYRSFMGLQEKNYFLEVDWLLDQFAHGKQKARELMMKYSYEGIEAEWHPDSCTLGKLVLGSKEFFNFIVETYVDSDDLNDDILACSEYRISKNIEVETILEKLGCLNVDDRLQEKLLIYYLREHTNLGLEEIGKLVNKKSKAVSKSYFRTREMLEEEQSLKYLKELFVII